MCVSSKEVLRVDRFSVGWLMLVGSLFLLVISIYYKCSVQQLVFKCASEVLQITGSNTVIFVVLEPRRL